MVRKRTHYTKNLINEELRILCGKFGTENSLAIGKPWNWTEGKEREKNTTKSSLGVKKEKRKLLWNQCSQG